MRVIAKQRTNTERKKKNRPTEGEVKKNKNKIKNIFQTEKTDNQNHDKYLLKWLVSALIRVVELNQSVLFNAHVRTIFN